MKRKGSKYEKSCIYLWFGIVLFEDILWCTYELKHRYQNIQETQSKPKYVLYVFSEINTNIVLKKS